MTSRASKFSLEDFKKMTGGSIERAYEILGGYAAQALASSVRGQLQRPCPKCNKFLQFFPIKDSKLGYTGRWVCSDQTGEPIDWCGYEEFVTDSLESIADRYAVVVPEETTVIPAAMTASETGTPAMREHFFAAIYPNIPRRSKFAQTIPDWARRRCPQCGTPMVFYPVIDSDKATGVFACPNGWNTSEDPEDWCGYEEIVNTPVKELFDEYYARSPTKLHAAASLLLKECPRCGDYLVPRPVEVNDNGWKTRWICQRGFTKDDPEQLCGYEELSTETIGSYINAVNKIIAESK